MPCLIGGETIIWLTIAIAIFLIGLIIIFLGGIFDDALSLSSGIVVAIFFWLIAYVVLIIVYIIIWAVWTVAEFFGFNGWLIIAFLIVLAIIVGIIRR